MTRNTKLYKTNVLDINGEKVEVLYRDLTALEIAYLNNIKNEQRKAEMTAKISIQNIDSSDIHWQVLEQIGISAWQKSTRIMLDEELFELTIREFRDSVQKDPIFNLIKKINEVFPGESLTNLLKMTYKDLLELACLCEVIVGKKMFNISGPFKTNTETATSTNNGKTEFADDGKTLREKMEELGKFS